MTAQPDSEAISAFINTVHGKSPGLVSVFVLPGGAFAFYSAADLVENAGDLADIARTHDVYVGAGSMAGAPRRGRGGADDIVSIPGVWADIDVDTGCHGTAADELPLPTIEGAHLLVSDVGLEPTVVVDTGGGLHVWWLFDAPLVIATEHDRAEVTALSAGFGATLVELGRRRGVHVDNVSDLARVMRPAGTMNRKRGADAVRLLTCQPDRRYEPAQIAAVILPRVAAEVAAPTLAPPSTKIASRWSASRTSPADAFCRAMSWADILEPHGWHLVAVRGDGEHWRHPTASHPVSAIAHTDPPVLVNFSSNSGLPAGSRQRLTKFRVWAHLNFGGDESAAARHLIELVRETA